MKNKIKSAIKLLQLLSKPKKILDLHTIEETVKKKEAKLYEDFYQDFNNFNTLANKEQKAVEEHLYPCLHDKTTTTQLDPTYFYQDAWAFERIYANKPTTHFDIGSHHKFVAHLSKVTNLTMVDIRPLSLPMESINFVEGSILELPFKDDSIESLSSLCVVEHIGLGRYGDPINPNGSKQAFDEILRVLKKGAFFYVSLPVSDKYITRFNAGVIFDYQTLRTQIEEKYIVNDQMFIVGPNLIKEFVPNDNFGTTILLELIKK